MADTGTTRTLRDAIQRSGYYPELVAEGIEFAVGEEPIKSWFVHQETTLDVETVRRHVTVLALTPTRLIVGHTDEHSADEDNPVAYATTSTESIALSRISTVVLSRTVADPARYEVGAPPTELVLTVGWGAVSRLDLEPATCGDPNCEADHGYTGSVTADDLSVRVSEAGDGRETVAEMLVFATALSAAVGTR
ncbi:DUF5998 family protein [Sporichthya brevicatena]|uniref:DUF5998 family protein n=1 Tax=Sporichthya brevicatena TaxID=171442 RepID=A0ABP3SK84_9ACTN